MHAFAHPENDKRVAVGIVVLVALAASTSLAWTARLTPPGAFDAIPPYWHETAAWLDEHNTGSPPGRVLVAPGAPFATQVWGTSHDEPLQVLGGSPWGVRDSIPLTPPQTIRALDSVQRLFAAGRPSAGLADTLARQGISYVVVRNDLDPETSRSARPVLVHRAIDGSPGCQGGQFGDPVGPGTLRGFITDSGLRPKYPAVEIYRVDDAGRACAPYLTDTDAMARVDGGPEALLRLDERRRLLDQPPLGPMLLTADAQRAGRRHRSSPSPTLRWRARPTTAASTTTRRRSARTTMRGTPSTGCSTIPPAIPEPCTASGPAAVSRCRVRRRIRPHCPTSRPRPARRRHRRRLVDQLGVQRLAVRRRAVAAGRLRPSGHQRHHHHHAERDGRRRAGPPHRGLHRQRDQHAALRRGGQADHRGAALRRDAVGADHRGRPPTTDRPACSSASRTSPSRSTTPSGFAHPIELRHTVSVPGPPPNSAVAQWDLGSELLGRSGCADRSRRRALRGGDGVVPGGAGEPEPDADRAGADVGDADGVGAARGRPQARRPDQPARDSEATGDSDPIDVLGSVYAAADGDPRTAWTAPQRVVQHKRRRT